MQLIEKIQLIIHRIQEVNDDIKIDPGLPQQKVLDVFSSFGFSPPSEVIELYTLYNGISDLDAYFHLQDIFYVKREYKFWKSVYSQENWWQDSWLPLLTMNGDVVLHLDCDNLSVIAVDRELGRVEKIAHYYEHYLDAILELFETNALFYNKEEDYFEIDDKIWHEVRKKYQIKDAW